MLNLLYYFAARIDAGSVNVPANDADAVFGNILRLVYMFTGITAVIVIVVGGILYTLSSGESAEIKRAKETILYGVVGLIVVMFAFVITGFVTGRFV